MIQAYYINRWSGMKNAVLLQTVKKQRQTIILNHPQGWDGKPKGLPETAGSPKYLNDMVTRFFVAVHGVHMRNGLLWGRL
jgi:hypothetical protein